MKGLIVYKTDFNFSGGFSSQLREFRDIPDSEADRLKRDMTTEGFKVFDFHEE